MNRLDPIVRPLLEWYRQNARDLPWRRTRDPYAIWLSEIMCQQTRVQAAIEYYLRFLNALPDVASLAAADEERLLKLWEGLGYYSRARNLQKAARVMAERYGGQVPGSYEELCSLPGIGEYTAGAVASIAFGIPVPCVDGNVLRVITRVTADEREIDRGDTKADITRQVAAVIPSDCPGDFNQALMELGATVCLPNGEPLCAQCPLAGQCEGRRLGKALSLPRKSPKKERRIERRTILFLIKDGKIALQKRPESGLLAGMWEFPALEGDASADQARAAVQAMGFEVASLRPGPKAKHVFSHVEWHMQSMEMELDGDNRTDGGFVWADHGQLLHEIALPSAFRAYKKQAVSILTGLDREDLH